MNFKTLICITVIIPTIFSCKESSEVLPETKGSYLLKKKSFNHEDPINGMFSNFKYNQNNLIEEIQIVQWGTYVIDDSEERIWQDTSFYYFEYENELVAKTTHKMGLNIWFHEYEYLNGLLIKKTTYYADNSIQEYSLYTYDNEDKLSEVSRWTDKEIFNYKLEYKGESLTSVTKYYLWQTLQTKTKYEYSDFDNETNFSTRIKGLPISFTGIGLADTYSSVSPHNFQLEKYYKAVDVNSEFGDPTTITKYQYEYNQNGLPVLRHYGGGWNVTFEYERVEIFD